MSLSTSIKSFEGSKFSLNGHTSTVKAADELLPLKKAVWVYLLLLFFEGALRKWVLPGLATPLLIVRDPVALWLLVKGIQKGLLKGNNYLALMVFITLVSIFTAVVLGHGNLFVAVYGARLTLLHFPLIFIIGRLFTRDDVLYIGKIILWISIPMTLLVALQFYSPQSAWVNRGIGGDMEGGGFNGGALGYFRPPGTFSFTNGNVLFFSFVAPFVFYFWIYPKQISRLLLLGSTGALLVAIPLAISRNLFFQVAVTFFFLVMGISRNPKYLGKLMGAVIIGAIAFIVASQLSFFSTSITVFTTRFDGANESEGGIKGVLGDRYLGGMLSALTSSPKLPFWGYGLGTGTSVGGTLLYGVAGLTIGEDEWGRIVAELGPALGLGMVFLRLSVAIKLAWLAYKRLTTGDMLPWLLASFALINMAQGQWAQPAGLGFAIVSAGLMIASFNESKQEEEEEPVTALANVPQ